MELVAVAAWRRSIAVVSWRELDGRWRDASDEAVGAAPREHGLAVSEPSCETGHAPFTAFIPGNASKFPQR